MNREKKRIVFISFIFCILFGIFYFFFPLSEKKYATYQDGNAVLSNPSRGLYEQIKSNRPDKIKKLDPDIRLVLLEYNLDGYQNDLLPPEKLEELSLFFNLCRENGKKIIFRAAYGFGKDAANNDISDLLMVQKHMSEIAPILNENKDILLCVQAGMIGPWGEWHNSLLFDKDVEAERVQVQNTVLSTWLKLLDEEIPINVRRPSFIREAKEKGVAIQRIGFHDDGLLATDTDLGTYEKGERERELLWCKDFIVTGVNGGEMPQWSAYTSPDNVVKEFSLLKIGYLNGFYNKEILDRWKSENLNGSNAYDYILNHLGYRFFLSDMTFPKRVEKRLIYPKLEIQFTLKNTGFAPIEKGYGAELLIVAADGTKKTYSLPLSLENLAGNGEKESKVKFELGKELRGKDFLLGIRIYDVGVASANQEKYSVTLANNELKNKEGIHYFLKGNWGKKGWTITQE